MKAERLLRRRSYFAHPGEFIELVIWRLPMPVPGSGHAFKYRLAYVRDGVCAIRYDNERNKGDHRHGPDGEQTYLFVGLDKLVEDFEDDVRRLRHGQPSP